MSINQSFHSHILITLTYFGCVFVLHLPLFPGIPVQNMRLFSWYSSAEYAIVKMTKKPKWLLVYKLYNYFMTFKKINRAHYQQHSD